MYDVSGNKYHANIHFPSPDASWSYSCPTICGDGVAEGPEACDGDAACSPTCELTWLSCKHLLDSESPTLSGLYWIDPDAGGPVEAAQLYCDMQNGGWTLVGNYYDSEDDMPKYDRLGCLWMAADGRWVLDNGCGFCHKDFGAMTSSAVSLAFIEALGQSAGQTELTVLCSSWAMTRAVVHRTMAR